MAPVPSTSSPSAPSLWARLDTLRVKLFLAIAGANVVLVLAAYGIYGWSFDQGLVEYLNRADEARLTPLIQQLADGYEREGNWRWISEDRQRWPDLLREVLGLTLRAPGGAGPVAASASASAASSVTQPPFTTIDPRLMLFDADRQLLIGPPDRAAQAVLKPIKLQQRVVGHLGYVPRLQVVTSLERVFSAQQNNRFLVIALGLLAAVVLTAAFIAQWLAQRLAVLGAGTAALMRGEYATRIQVQGHDELARLGGDFNRLAQTLEATQIARRQWLADIAHELRTPLATLRAEIEALQDGVRPLTQQRVGSLAQEVAQLTRLVEDLRLLSMSDLGALSVRKERLDLGELIDECLAARRDAMQALPLRLQWTATPGVHVLADADRLAQVFGNLLQNTLRYSDPPAALQVSLETHDGRAHVVWQDSSPGVAAHDLPRLTDRLFRVDSSRARVSGGSGLGLAIVKAIVEVHGGTLEASASALGGLRWDLWLPLAQETKEHNA